MKEKEKEILELERALKDNLESIFHKENTEYKSIQVNNIIFVGDITWKDKINGKDLSENVFAVKLRETVKTQDGKEEIKEINQYYLGDKCIGGYLEEENPVFKNSVLRSEPDKMQAVKELLDKVNLKELEEEYSLEVLEGKELAEVLSAYLGVELTPEEAKKYKERLDKEKDDRIEEKEEGQQLTKEQTEEIKQVSGVQKIKLSTMVDGKKTLGERLDLQGYSNIYIVYSERVRHIDGREGTKTDNTTYSLIGMPSDGSPARKLDKEFEIDPSIGNNANSTQTKIRADETATQDNKDSSVLRRKSNGAGLGIENDGNIQAFFYAGKTREENQNVGIQIETSKTPIISSETREIMNKNRGDYQMDHVQDEVEEHKEMDCTPKNSKDFDGDKDTQSHDHEEGEFQISKEDYIPNTQKTWGEFARECNTTLEKAIERFEKVKGDNPEMTNQQVLDKIAEIDFGAPSGRESRNRY